LLASSLHAKHVFIWISAAADDAVFALLSQDKASVAAAQVPQLLLLPPQEVRARLEALSASMKVGAQTYVVASSPGEQTWCAKRTDTVSCCAVQVPLERVRLVAAEKPILLSQSPKVIRDAAAKLPKS
jgi:hypothetical protein